MKKEKAVLKILLKHANGLHQRLGKVTKKLYKEDWPSSVPEALNNNTSLTYIDLYGNKLGDYLKKAIDNKLEINKRNTYTS